MPSKAREWMNRNVQAYRERQNTPFREPSYWNAPSVDALRGNPVQGNFAAPERALVRPGMDELPVNAPPPQVAEMPISRLTEAMGFLPGGPSGDLPAQAASVSPLSPTRPDAPDAAMTLAGSTPYFPEERSSEGAAMLAGEVNRIGASASAASPYRIPGAPLRDDPDAAATMALRERLGLGGPNAPGGDPLLAQANMRKKGYSWNEELGWHDPNRDATAETSQDVIRRMSAWDQVEKSMNATDKSGDPTPEQLVRARGIQRGLQREGVPLANAMAQSQMMSGVTGEGGMAMSQAAQMGPEGFAKFEELATMQKQFSDQMALLNRAHDDAVRSGDLDRAVRIKEVEGNIAAQAGSLGNQLMAIVAGFTGQRLDTQAAERMETGRQGVQRFGIQQGAENERGRQQMHRDVAHTQATSNERISGNEAASRENIARTQFIEGPQATQRANIANMPMLAQFDPTMAPALQSMGIKRAAATGQMTDELAAALAADYQGDVYDTGLFDWHDDSDFAAAAAAKYNVPLALVQQWLATRAAGEAF